MELFFFYNICHNGQRKLYRLILQPILGNAFSYSITINNVKIIYNSGVNILDASYVIQQYSIIKLQPTLENIS
jgi:hypothetical protein